ncbi:hypothetical protein KKA47_00905, partial [bacterium]|nr:hypothetical protein [bacterium]
MTIQIVKNNIRESEELSNYPVDNYSANLEDKLDSFQFKDNQSQKIIAQLPSRYTGILLADASGDPKDPFDDDYDPDSDDQEKMVLDEDGFRITQRDREVSLLKDMVREARNKSLSILSMTREFKEGDEAYQRITELRDRTYTHFQYLFTLGKSEEVVTAALYNMDDLGKVRDAIRIINAIHEDVKYEMRVKAGRPATRRGEVTRRGDIEPRQAPKKIGGKKSAAQGAVLPKKTDDKKTADKTIDPKKTEKKVPDKGVDPKKPDDQKTP